MIALLDALDAFMDRICSFIAANNDSISDEVRAAYHQARQQIDAWRDVLEPPAIYPEPAPVLNCPHPYDRDYAILVQDPVKGSWSVIRCCSVCGEVWPPHELLNMNREDEKLKKKKTPPTLEEQLAKAKARIVELEKQLKEQKKD